MADRINLTCRISAYFVAVSEVLEKVNRDEVNEAMNALFEAYKRGSSVYCFGNGGSAATASHMMNDFNKGVSYNLDKKFNFHCLNDNVAILTALANDVGYEFVYAKQLEGKLKDGDLIVAVSGSGNSKNIIMGAEYAISQGCKVIGITGYDGGKLRQLANYHMHAPSSDMQIVEDIHMVFNHMMMKTFRDLLKTLPCGEQT